MTDFIAFGKIENFSEGWGVVSYNGSKSHFWKHEPYPLLTDVQRVNSKCGLTRHIYNISPMLNEGNYPRCKKCSKFSNGAK